MDSAEVQLTIVNALGLHARAAALLVNLANRFSCDVTLKADGQEVNGKSIMGVLMLAAAQGTELSVVCAGEGASTCAAEITKLVNNKFGEAS